MNPTSSHRTSPSRRGTLAPLFALVVLVALAAPVRIAAATTTPAKPNIVFLFADDWGWGDLSCHGSTWLKTPHLDRLASEGIDFGQFNVLNPVCSPSRTAVMTGQYPARWGVHQHFAHPTQNHERGMPDWLDPRAPTLPRLLKEAGYRTGHFGKWHLTNRQTPGAPRPEAYGIDEWAVFNGGAGWPAARVNETAANTVAFIRAHRARPFFVNVWLHETHTPHSPSPEAMAQWRHLDEQKQVYAAVVTDGDNAVGRILAALREAGVEQNTLVLFATDNGPESTGKVKRPAYTEGDSGVTGYDTYYSVGETGGLRGRKRSLFEGGVRVPFLVRWPGHAPAGRKDGTTVFTGVDLLPTLCAAAGIALPPDQRGDGENLLPALLGQPVARTRPIFWEWRGNQAEPDWWPRLAVRDGNWKLLRTYDAKRVSLHRLPDDRAEAHDVSAENPAIVARLRQLALDWKASLPAQPPADCFAPADQIPPLPVATKKAPARKAGK
ncbi:MAG: sulfatase-like hydrolase/transferase [Verrucomicrobia bacterium]|nr:sulfatase-like hydrolase/transferase [Verrucomicrobiota bacterium]